jgi:hypothetical protein
LRLHLLLSFVVGGSVIYPLCGSDGTDAFEEVHPESYLSMVEEYKVGEWSGEALPDPTPSPTDQTLPVIDAATLVSHNNPDDCWVVYYDYVYDMTVYAPTHPTGTIAACVCCMLYDCCLLCIPLTDWSSPKTAASLLVSFLIVV